MKNMYKVEYTILWKGQEIEQESRTRNIDVKPGDSVEKTLKRVSGITGKYDVRIINKQHIGTSL